MLAELIDRIYEAAFLPEKWVEALNEVSGSTHSTSGTIVIYPGDAPPRGVSTELTRPAFEQFCTSDAWKNTMHPMRNLETRTMMARAGFVCDADVLTPAEMAVDSVVSALRSMDLGWQVANWVLLPDNQLGIITFERWLREGRHSLDAMATFAALRPHFSRAALLAGRLSLERAKASVATLETIGLPAAVLTRQGRVIASNDLLDGLSLTIIPTAGGGLAIRGSQANTALKDALLHLAASVAPKVQSIAVPASETRPPGVVHLLPVRRAAREIMAGSDVMLIVTEVGRPGAPDGAILSSLFDLTPAETRIAASLAAGNTIAETAANLSVGVATVRTQLSAVFSKTGTSRQAELVSLISTMRGFGTRK